MTNSQAIRTSSDVDENIFDGIPTMDDAELSADNGMFRVM